MFDCHFYLVPQLQDVLEIRNKHTVPRTFIFLSNKNKDFFLSL